VDVGPGIVAARANGRQFATAGFVSDLSSTSPPFYVAPGAGASQAFRLPDGAIGYGPGIVTDRAGHPHTLYTAGQPFGSQPFDPVVHAWHDGTAWQTEEIAGAARYSPVRFDIGLDGTLHGTWFNGISTRAVASLVNGSWTIDSLTNQGGGTVELSGDETGAVHLVLQGNAGLEYWRRTTSGWTSEAVPSTSGFLREWHVFASTGQVTVVCRLDSADFNQMIVTAVTRTSAGWSSVETVAALPWQGQNFAASRSPDGLRIGIVSKVFQQTGVDGYLWVRSASGTVERHWYGTDGAVSTGFTADGRAWVLDALRDRIVPPTETAQVTLFEEP